MHGLRDALASWTTSADTRVTIRLAQGVYRVDGAAGDTLGLFNSQPHPAT